MLNYQRVYNLEVVLDVFFHDHPLLLGKCYECVTTIVYHINTIVWYVLLLLHVFYVFHDVLSQLKSIALDSIWFRWDCCLSPSAPSTRPPWYRSMCPVNPSEDLTRATVAIAMSPGTFNRKAQQSSWGHGRQDCYVGMGIDFYVSVCMQEYNLHIYIYMYINMCIYIYMYKIVYVYSIVIYIYIAIYTYIII